MKCRCVIKSLILILCLISSVTVQASGGDAHEDRGLNGQQSPDFPLNNYVAGHLGLINFKFRISYLVIAYRYLSNNPLSQIEQQNVLSSYALFFSCPMEGDFRVDANKTNREMVDEVYLEDTSFSSDDGEQWWQKIMSLPLNERIQSIINTYPKKIKAFTKYRLAKERFTVIAERLTAANLSENQKNDVLGQWATLQDQVFNKNFDVDKARKSFGGLPVEITQLLKLDMDYMEAASYFTFNNELSALKSKELFTQLANNEQYPWHEWAAYLSARIQTRMACPESDDTPPQSSRADLLAKAFTDMQTLALNAKDPSVKKAAYDYKSIIQSRFDRKGAIIDLVNTMNYKITKNNFYKMMYYNNTDESYDSPIVWDDMTETESEVLFWIFNYTSADTKKTFPIAYEHWRKTPENTAWLLVALRNIKEANASQQIELLTAARKITPDHPAFFSFRALLIEGIAQLEGNSKQSKLQRHQLIDHTLKQLKAGHDFSTHTYFAQKGIPLATTIENLLSYGFFVPSASMIVLYPPVYPTKHPYYSPIELSEALNYLPLSMLVEVLQSKILPTLPRRELYASVWARAMILGRYDVADQIANKTSELNPALKKYIHLSIKTKNADQREKILVKALLYFPELNPIIHLKNTWLPQWDNTPIFNGIKSRWIRDSHSNVYWCDGGALNIPVYSLEPRSQFHKGPWNSLLTAGQQKQLNKEQDQLNALPNAAVWLLDKTNKLAKKYPRDKENAELLALAINLTRVMDCYSSNSLEARRAFYQLKVFYASSEAAKKVQYHY